MPWELTGNNGTNPAADFLGTTDNQPLVIQRNGGNVGIGTINPANKLHIHGNSPNFALTFTNAANAVDRRGYRIAFDNERLTFQRADDSGAFVDNHMAIRQDTGNVGIGTITPNEQLELTGNLRLPPTTGTTGIIKSGSNTLIHTFGGNNFFAGENAGNLAMVGSNNTAVGQDALRSNTTGSDNTAMGLNALFSNGTGGNNTATGENALRFNTQGVNNTATGQSALSDNTTGNNNTATGLSALSDNTTGGNNTAMGMDALRLNTTGGNNTAVGQDALRSNTTGSNNTGIGVGANVSVGNLSNATAIGAGAVVDASNKIRLGNAAVTVIEGQVGFTGGSDARQKENFLSVDREETLYKLCQIAVRSWNFKGQDPTRFRHYGPNAQDFFAAFGHDDLGTIGSETTITTTDIDGIMMVAIQALERQTVELQKELRRTQEELAQLQAEKK
jgi:hypothetical protein